MNSFMEKVISREVNKAVENLIERYEEHKKNLKYYREK